MVSGGGMILNWSRLHLKRKRTKLNIPATAPAAVNLFQAFCSPFCLSLRCIFLHDHILKSLENRQLGPLLTVSHCSLHTHTPQPKSITWCHSLDFWFWCCFLFSDNAFCSSVPYAALNLCCCVLLKLRFSFAIKGKIEHFKWTVK